MPFGYLGTTPNQKVKNSGVFSVSEALQLQKDGALGGSLQLIQNQDVTEVSNIDFTSIKENKYDVHLLQVQVEDTASGASLRGGRIQFYESGVLETASVYEYAVQYGSGGGSFGELRSTGATHIISGGYDSNPLNTHTYYLLYNLGNSSKYSFTTFQTTESWTTSIGFYVSFGGGVLPQTSTVDGVRYSFGNADTFTGNAKLFGVKQI